MAKTRKKRLKRKTRFTRFVNDIAAYTPFTKMVLLLAVLWLIFSAAIYLAENDVDGSSIDSYGDALYWGVAAFSTAGIAETPTTSTARFIGGIWIVVGSVLFFGAIVSTVTGYFTRPMQRPHKKIIDTIEYNLEQIDELSLEEIDLLRETVDTLIDHVEQLKAKQPKKDSESERPQA